MEKKTGILRSMGGRLAPPTAAQRSWRLALIALLLLPQTVVPATITVDADIGDPGCDLVEAMNNANDGAVSADCTAGDVPGPDTIELTVALTTLTTIDNYYPFGDRNGLPTVSSDITIEGNGNTIARDGAAPLFRIFAVHSDGTLTLNDATVSGGYSYYYYDGFGGPDDGGAIWNAGAVTLTNSTLSYNYAADGGGLYNGSEATADLTDSTVTNNYGSFGGGGIENREYATLTITNSTISDNDVDSGDGGGVANRFGDVTITDSTISGNFAYDGGGVSNRGGSIEVTTKSLPSGLGYGYGYGTLSITNSTVSGNYAVFDGGGIYNGFYGYATLTNSTVSDNYTYFDGGGIANGGGEGAAILTLTNSTVSGNYAYDGDGGGIYNGFQDAYSYVTNSTISGNEVYYGDGGGIYSYDGTYLYNSIVNDSSGGVDCDGGGFTDLGGNFSEDGTCPGGLLTTGVDIDGTLADNGGPTLTHALLEGSVAIDAAGACALATDQRGEPRDDGLCDSGSYELGVAEPCEDSLRDLAADILAADLIRFVRMSSARRSILASRAIGAANAMRFCSETTALTRLGSLIMLIDGIGRDYMTDSPNEFTERAQTLYDRIEAGECPDCLE